MSRDDLRRTIDHLIDSDSEEENQDKVQDPPDSQRFHFRPLEDIELLSESASLENNLID